MYDVFISYSHADKRFAAQVERALLAYRPPWGSRLRPRRLTVFRDESEAAGTQLSSELERALASSRRLVVVCSPAARASGWVEREIQIFRQSRSLGEIVPLLADGLTTQEAKRLGRLTDAAVPEALLADASDEPWCVDFREVASAGKRPSKARPGWFHLLASIYGATRAVIEQRERQRRLYRIASGVLVAVALLGAATLYQDQRRRGLSLEAAEAATRETNERAALKLALKAVELAPTEPAIRVLTTKLQAMLRPEYILPRPSVFLVSESEEHVAWADVIGRAFILDRRKNERHPICGFIYPVDELRFVPRNDFVVGFTAKDDYLQILDPTTGRRTGAASVRGPRVRLRMSVADNGATLVLTSYSKPTQRFRIPTLELIDETPAGALEDPQPDYKPRWRDVRTPLFSPSRDRFVQILENTLYAHSALGGEELWHADGAGLKEVAYSPDGSLVIAWGRDDLAASVAMFSSRDGKLLTRSPPHKLFSRRFQGTLFLDRSFELLPIGAQSKRMYFKSDYSLYVYDLDTGAHLATISTIDEQMDSTEARLSQLTNSPTRADLLALGRSLLNDCEVLR